MKLVNPLRLSAPLVILAAAFVWAPSSRAQEVAPDHFEIAPNPTAGSAAAAPATTAKQNAAPASSQAANKKNKNSGTQTVAANSGKNSSGAQKPEIVAVQDKSKLPARKQNNQ